MSLSCRRKGLSRFHRGGLDQAQTTAKPAKDLEDYQRADNPDGLSTFNWASFGQPGMVAHPKLVGGTWGMGMKRVQHVMTARLGSPQLIRQYLDERDVGMVLGE